MKANNSLRINMPRALELISIFFPWSWSDLSDIRLIRVRHNEGNCIYNPYNNNDFPRTWPYEKKALKSGHKSHQNQ